MPRLESGAPSEVDDALQRPVSAELGHSNHSEGGFKALKTDPTPHARSLSISGASGARPREGAVAAAGVGKGFGGKGRSISGLLPKADVASAQLRSVFECFECFFCVCLCL